MIQSDVQDFKASPRIGEPVAAATSAATC